MPLARRAGQAVAYALFIFAGLVVFNFFSEMAYRSPMLLHEYAHYIKQTIFPSDMLAVISTLRAAAYTGIGAIVMLICARRERRPALDGRPDPAGLPAPLAFLMGMAWFLCAVGAFTRDAGYLMINIVPLFMFLTPVFFPHNSLSPPWDILIYVNALTAYVEIMRDLVLTGRCPIRWSSCGCWRRRSSPSTSAIGSSTGTGMSSSTSSEVVVQTRHLGKAYQLYAHRSDWLKQVDVRLVEDLLQAVLGAARHRPRRLSRR